MKPTSIAVLTALLLTPCACSRPDPAVTQAAVVPGPTAVADLAVPALPPAPAAEPDPAPTPAEVAAFHAPVPK